MTESMASLATRSWKLTKVMRIAFAIAVACLVVGYVFLSHRRPAVLKVGRISDGAQQYPPSAIPYTLPAKAFYIASETRVIGCTVVVGQGQNPPYAEIRAVTTAKITSSIVPDESARYYLFFDGRAKDKNFDYDVETYDNGTLKSVVASIRDQAAPTAVSFSHALVQLPGPQPGGSSGPEYTTEIVELPKPSCGSLPNALRLNPSDPALITHQEDSWVPRGAGGKIDFHTFPDIQPLYDRFQLVEARWAEPQPIELVLNTAGVTAYDADEIQFWPPAAPAGCAPSLGDCSRVDAASEKPDPPLVDGFVIRNAVPAVLSISVCDATCAASSQHRLNWLEDRHELIPQFGALMLLKVRSGFAQDGGMQLKLSSEGVITKLQMQSTSALSSSVSKLGGDANDLVKFVRQP